MESIEAVSANNQALPISSDETAKFTAYSSAVHKVIVMVNTGILGLLQLMNQQSSIFETHKAVFLCFCVLILFYAVLRICEAIDVQLQPGLVLRLIVHTSHLFGVLAALVLFYVVCETFALVLLLPWLLWLSAVAYNTLNEFIIYSNANRSRASLPQPSPV